MLHTDIICCKNIKNNAFRKFCFSMLDTELKEYDERISIKKEAFKVSTSLGSLLVELGYCDSEDIYENEARELAKYLGAA